MVKLPTREIATGELVSGIVGTIDIGNLIQTVINLNEDIRRSNEITQRIVDYVTKTLPTLLNDAKNRALKSPQEIITDAQTFLPSYLSFITRNIQNQAVQSAGGFRIAATMLGQETKVYTALNQVDLASTVLLDIPALIAKTKATRYWNKELSPEYPSEKDSFMLYRLGKWSKSDFINYLREEQGLKPSDAENITEIREWQTGKPSLYDAYLLVHKGLKPKQYFYDLAIKGLGFTKEDADALFQHYSSQTGKPSLRDTYLMVQKGYLPEEYFYDLAIKGLGFSKQVADALYQHFSYDFSPSELLRLSDLIPLDGTWIEKKLNAVGMDSEDKAVFKSAIEKRTIRDETSKIWGLILDAYQWGLFTEKDLQDLLENWKFSQTEIDLRLQTGELLKLKLRVKLLRDAEIYLYRQGKLTETDLLTRLINLGISKDIANAIVRYEAAKKGVDWEIPES